MNSLQRVSAIITGGLMLIVSAILFLMPEDGTPIAVFILAVTLLLSAARLLIYYFTMARRMVGGKAVLLLGIFLLDFGIFTITIMDEHGVFLLLYLVGWHAFTGVVEILRARESYRHKGAWKFKALSGVINILVAIGCIINVDNLPVLTLIYSMGLCYSAVTRILSAFRKTEIVYIQ